jgi:hypothetical protein
LALAISTHYFGVKAQGRALAKALYQPFKFTVIAARPECWKASFEEVGIALCRTLIDEPDLLNRVISVLRALFSMRSSVALSAMNAASETCHTSKVSRARHPAVAAAIAL